MSLCFFFQAEDGIRDLTSSDVCSSDLVSQHAASPPGGRVRRRALPDAVAGYDEGDRIPGGRHQIGRASCRGKSVDLGGRRIIKKKKIESDRVSKENMTRRECRSA